jgi:hypothetical protein
MKGAIQQPRKPVLRANEALGRLLASAAATALLLMLATVTQAQNSQFLFDDTGNLIVQTADSTAVPQILTQPRQQVVQPGQLAAFSVVLADTSGVTYQWYFDGTTLIPGATNDTLLVTNVSSFNQGVYDVVLVNGSGTVTSALAALLIDSRGCGMPDSWQMTYFGNLNQNATGDFDGDGVSNLQEFLDGTNPTNAASALYRITLFNDGGAVVAVPDQPTYTNGQSVTLTATGSGANPFHAWTGDVVTRSNSITLTMTNNMSLFAHFTPVPFQWTNSAGGDWNVASNWTPNLVPGSNDTVVILILATVSLNSDADVADFTLGLGTTGPELTGTGTLVVHGDCTWPAGTMSGAGSTVIAPGGTLEIASGNLVNLVNRTLENHGTVSLTGVGGIVMDGAVITNDVGAMFVVSNGSSLPYAGGSPRFDNAGTFQTQAGSGTTTFGQQFAFNNYGTVNIESGSLSLAGGGAQTGTMTVPEGTAIIFAGGTFTSSGNSSITGAGMLMVSGGTATLAGTVNLSGSNVFTGGSVDFTGDYVCTNNAMIISGSGVANFDGTGPVSPSFLNLSSYFVGGSSLGGSDTVTVGSVMNWTGGVMLGSGRTVILPGATLNLGGTIYLTGRTLDNGGTALASGPTFFLTAAVMTNETGALFQILSPATFNGDYTLPRFDNAGTFQTLASGGTTAFDQVAFNNYGTANIQGGSLSLAGGGVLDGTVTVPAGTAIYFAGGTFASSGNSSMTGAGMLVVNGGTATLTGTVNVSGNNVFTGGSVDFTGNYVCTNNTMIISESGVANFDGTGVVAPSFLNLSSYYLGGTSLGGSENVTVGSVMNWTGGAMLGSGRTVIAPGATLNLAGTLYLTSRTLDNGGTALASGATLNMAAAVITNETGALFQIQSPATFNGDYTLPRFDNAGTFLTPASGGTTSFNQVGFNNYGAVNIQPGILLLRGGYVSSSNAVLNCALAGTVPGASYGQLQLSGAVTLNGTLGVNLTNHYIPTTNASFTVLTASALDGAFANFIYPSNGLSMILSNATTSEIVRVTGVTLQQTNLFSPLPGIISWWRAENNALDSAGTNNGTLTNGATYAPGEVGQSFLLDGIDDYVLIPDSPSLHPASATLEAWVLFNATNGFRLIMGKPVGSGEFDSFALWLSDGILNGVICDTVGGGPAISYSLQPVIGTWYHLAYSYDGATKQQILYANGVAVATGTGYQAIGYDTHPMSIGSDNDNGVEDGFFAGQIDEASIYNRALGADEIASIYNVGSAGLLPFSTYQRWKLVYLGDANAPDLGDPDGDGYPTLLEYGLAMNPAVADPPGLPLMDLYDYGQAGKRLRAVVNRDPTHNDVTIEVQGSGSLSGGWQILAASTNGLPYQGIGYVGGDGPGSDIKTVEIRDSLSITNALQRFLRVKVSH